MNALNLGQWAAVATEAHSRICTGPMRPLERTNA